MQVHLGFLRRILTQVTQKQHSICITSGEAPKPFLMQLFHLYCLRHITLVHSLKSCKLKIEPKNANFEIQEA